MIKSIFTLYFFTFFLCPLISYAEDVEEDITLEEIVEDSWINNLHTTISDSVYSSAAWFDDFFTDEGSVQRNPKVNARIRLEWRPKSRDWADVKARFRIKVKLPHLKNKVHLILSDEDETDQSQLPLESTNIQEEEEKFSASLRYMHSNDRNKYTDTRLGITGGDIFIRSRHKRYFNWDKHRILKIEPSIFYFLDEGLGGRLLIEYNFQQNPENQYRINYNIEASESFSGIRWNHGFFRLKHLDDKTASVTSLQIEGVRNGDRGFVVDNYTLSYRYRFNAFKNWLFFEIEPFLEWPEIENYHITPGIALRVEGHFYKG